MDFDGDGVVTQREFPNQTIFKVFDEDRSGEITRTEFHARLGRTADRGPITGGSALVPIGKQVDWFHFHKDYFPGTRDPDGQLLGCTELMRLIGRSPGNRTNFRWRDLLVSGCRKNHRIAC